MLDNILLERPIAFIDLETTGVHPHSDRIIEMSILKIQPDGHREHRSYRVNPGVPIPAETTAVHGITDEDVASEPSFSRYANAVCDFLDDCDLSGFNLITFDLPFLEAELARAGIEFDRKDRQLVDSMVIYHQKEQYEPSKRRNLQAAYQQYCGRELSAAHGAEADVTASAEVLNGLVREHDDLPKDIHGLGAFCSEIRKDYIDIEGRFQWVKGEATFAFGKCRGQSLAVVTTTDPGYLRWILGQDFRPDVCDIIARALDGEFPQMP